MLLLVLVDEGLAIDVLLANEGSDEAQCDDYGEVAVFRLADLLDQLIEVCRNRLEV